MHEMNKVFDHLRMSPQKRQIIQLKLEEKLSYQPKIGIFGKTGAGKSSLTNALFGQDTCKISNVEACTRDPQEVTINMGGKGIKLVDVPGVGENQDRDEEYGKLYAKLLPELDLVLWVLKGDDRALSTDELFYKNIVKPHIDEGKPFFFVLNQVDKIEPYTEWDEENSKPSVQQAYNIDRKVNDVARIFECPPGKVIAVSANKNYNLDILVDSFIFELPREQKLTVGRNVNPENISKKTTGILEKSWFDTVADVFSSVGEFLTETAIDIFFKSLDVIFSPFGCFITTATCETLGKPDNCYELNLFRNFRDSWLINQPDGKALIEEYYEVAPQIVRSINQQKESKQIYDSIWNKYLSDCIAMIEKEDYLSCKRKYVAMVRNLESKFL